jgi:hypothetical protein
MPSSDSATVGQDNTGRLSWRSWQDAIGRRLSRSATVALLLSPVGLILISVTRLLIVSDYNPVTASAIVSSGGYVDSLLGTVIPLVPLLLPYAALALLLFNRVILAIISLVAAALVSPVLSSSSAVEKLAGRDWHHITDAAVIKLVLFGFLALVTFLLLMAVLIGLGFSMFSRSIGVIACIALIPFVSQVYSFPLSKSFYVGIIRQPWLPAEMIAFSSGQTIVGYVLSDGGSSLTFLKNDNRAVYYYPDSLVTKRQVCRIGPVRQLRPLVTIVPAATTPSSTPSCQSRPARPPSTRVPTSNARHQVGASQCSSLNAGQ